MYQPDASGYTAWKGVDTLTKKQLVIRHRHSRNARAFGGFGMRQDQFEITEEGKAVAQKCKQRRGDSASSTSASSSTSVNTIASASSIIGGIASSLTSQINCKCQKPAKISWATQHGKRVRVWRCASSSSYKPFGKCFFNHPCDGSVPPPAVSAAPCRTRRMCPTGSCKDCLKLSKFMSSKESRIEFKVGTQRRKHLHEVCEGLGVQHASEHSGTNRRKLVVTKATSTATGSNSSTSASCLAHPSSIASVLRGPENPMNETDSNFARCTSTDRLTVGSHIIPTLAPTSHTGLLSRSRAPTSSLVRRSNQPRPKLDKASLRKARLIAIEKRQQKRFEQKQQNNPPTGALARMSDDTPVDLALRNDESIAGLMVEPAHNASTRNMVMCLVDDWERLQNKDPNRIFQRCQQEHARIKDLRVCVGRMRLAIGDYTVRCRAFVLLLKKSACYA